jgi:hypothetical protein
MKSLEKLAGYFGRLAVGGYKSNLAPVLDLIGSSVKAEAEKEIGEYQDAIGSYPATAELSDVTIEIKQRLKLGKGGEADSPLWATGKYHDSIQSSPDVNSLSVSVGTNVDYVIYQELGTGKIPPRPIFGPATLRAIPPLLPTISAAAAMGIKGGVWEGLSAEGITFTKNKPNANILP